MPSSARRTLCFALDYSRFSSSSNADPAYGIPYGGKVFYAIR